MADEEFDVFESLDFFTDCFFRDLDSWFSADIACCDNCYDDFIKSWPLVLRDETDFTSIDLNNTFYQGCRRVKQAFTEEEYKELLPHLRCDRCGSPLQNNIWLYNFSFSAPGKFESEAYELAKRIEKTPYLVLENHLAKRTFDEIKSISPGLTKTELKIPLFRGRTMKGTEPHKVDFNPPPKKITTDGRYNHAGLPVTYMATSQNTCYYELRKPSADLWVAEFQLNGSYLLLDFTSDDLPDESLLRAIIWSSLASSPEEGEGWHKPQYHFTRFISDCCRYLGFDGIIYPSVRIGTGNNYVFFDEKILESADFKSIIEYKLK